MEKGVVYSRTQLSGPGRAKGPRKLRSAVPQTGKSTLACKKVIFAHFVRHELVDMYANCAPKAASERHGLAKRAPKARASPIHFARGFDAPSHASRCAKLVRLPYC